MTRCAHSATRAAWVIYCVGIYASMIVEVLAVDSDLQLHIALAGLLQLQDAKVHEARKAEIVAATILGSTRNICGGV
jgi:hypothetical protein